jgi:hypothetical protein
VHMPHALVHGQRDSHRLHGIAAISPPKCSCLRAAPLQQQQHVQAAMRGTRRLQ